MTLVKLRFRAPLHPDNLFGHLAATAVPGVEEWRAGAYRRTLALPHGGGIVALRPQVRHVEAELELDDPRDAESAIALCRRLLDLDADPATVDGGLRRDALLAPLVDAAPGRRVPGAVDGGEMAMRAVLGQQVSTAAARTHAARMVAVCGERVSDSRGGLTHRFPSPEAVAALDPAVLALPRSRVRALLGLARALASGALDLSPGVDHSAARAGLLALDGIGPWTTETVMMRALADSDAFLPRDLGVRIAATRLGLPSEPRALVARAERWRPWRAYAVQHLWATGDHAVNRLPAPGSN